MTRRATVADSSSDRGLTRWELRFIKASDGWTSIKGQRGTISRDVCLCLAVSLAAQAWTNAIKPAICQQIQSATSAFPPQAHGSDKITRRCANKALSFLLRPCPPAWEINPANLRTGLSTPRARILRRAPPASSVRHRRASGPPVRVHCSVSAESCFSVNVHAPDSDKSSPPALASLR